MANEQIMQEFEVLETGSQFLSKNFKSLQKSNPDMFVAVEDSQIIAAAYTFDEITAILKNMSKHLNNVIIEYIPKKGEIVLY